ncbi:RNA-binding protein [Coralliovum pocilloporae]|uniref:RNA-binding protein n=1 Tax=Coralliovum pocilloporae TaxID=3066369 RepID=UPI003306A6AE
MARASKPVDRTCLVTRDTKPVDQMIRFVLSPDGQVTPDLKRSLPGRGVWITGSRDCVQTAVTKKLFARGFRTDAKVDNDLPDRIDELLQKATLGGLGLATKAGQVVTGFAKVESAISSGKAIALVQASDGAPDGIRKMKQVVARATDCESRLKVIRLFTSEQLNQALGRMNVIHAALLSKRACSSFLEKARQLALYRGLES